MTNSEAVLRFLKDGFGIECTWEEFIEACNGESIHIVPTIAKAREYCELVDAGHKVEIVEEWEK